MADADEPPLPFADQAFDLVVSRHPVRPWWTEIARALAPGGTYFAQHVGPYSVFEIVEKFRGCSPRRSATTVIPTATGPRPQPPGWRSWTCGSRSCAPSSSTSAPSSTSCAKSSGWSRASRSSSTARSSPRSTSGSRPRDRSSPRRRDSSSRRASPPEGFGPGGFAMPWCPR
ncbi:hypothetical protein NKG05_08340 [Oerskovia sp. M15]